MVGKKEGPQIDPDKQYDAFMSMTSLLMDTNAKAQVALNLLIDIKSNMDNVDKQVVLDKVKSDFKKQINNTSELLVKITE